METNNNSEIIDKVMWETYENSKNSNYLMGGLETPKRIEILELLLLPYFIKNEEYEICEDIKNQLYKLKNNDR